MRVIDAVAPPRLGRSFRWLLASAWVSNASDGIALAAGPLLVASLTDEPFFVALAAILQQLPFLVFGLHAGVIADRLDRRRLVVWANLARAAVLTVLVATMLGGVVSLAVVLTVLFLLGTAETFSDTTSGTLVPMFVDRDDLGVANARLRFGQITLNRLVTPPLGAVLFAAGMAVPFVAQVVLLTLAAVLVARIGATPPVERPDDSTAWHDILAGMRWVWGHPAIRRLVLTIFAFNITFGATYGIMVLYARDRLGLGPAGYGVLVTFGGLGGIIGTVIYGWLERHVGRSGIMRAGLIIETLTHLILVLTTVPAVAFATMFVFGIHEAAWGTTSSTIRHRVVPAEFQGRVGAVNMVAMLGSLVIGSALGGLMASWWGITAPFWFAFAGSAAILARMWRGFGDLEV